MSLISELGLPARSVVGVARHSGIRRWARVLLFLGVIAVGAIALTDRWSQVRAHLSQLGPGTLVGAFIMVVVALFAAMMSWRTLLGDLGSPLGIRASARIVFLSQLGKYLPGSVWPYLAQIELGREHHVPRTRSAAVSVLAVLISLVSGLLIAAATMPWASPSATRRFWPVFLAVPILVALMHPRILNGLLGWALRVLRRPPFEERVSFRGIGVALTWSAAAWFVSGLQIWFLAADVAHLGIGALPVAIGAYALAWSAGFLFVIAPAGAGVREAALVAALSPVMSTSAALTVALVSRLLTTAGDLVGAGVAVLLGAHRKEDLAASDIAARGVQPGDGEPTSAAT